jgi:hypothetical protein
MDDEWIAASNLMGLFLFLFFSPSPFPGLSHAMAFLTDVRKDAVEACPTTVDFRGA